MLAPLKRVSSLAFLLFAGAAVPLLVLYFGAGVLGFAPLTEGEKNLIANYQHLNFDSLGPLCRLGRKFSGAQKKIAVFGASSAEGAMATPEHDFPTLLHHRLSVRFPGTWAVSNLARSAKTSFWVKECMKSAVQDQASYWIVYEGHNDFTDIYGGGVSKTSFLLRHPGAYSILKGLLDTPMSGWLRPFIRTGSEPVSWHAHLADLNRVLAISEENYREMISLAHASGVRLVLTTVISNLDWAPSAVVLPGTPAEMDAGIAFLKAQTAFIKKDFPEALRLFRVARDNDTHPWRAPSIFNELLRKLAKEFPADVVLIDLEKDFETEFMKRKIGCEFFGSKTYCDELHPNDFTHSWIAKKIESSLFPAGAK